MPERRQSSGNNDLSDGAKRLPKAKLVEQIRLYVEGGPRYMVGDIIFNANETSLIILEVKSGNIHFTNPAAAEGFKLEAGRTFGAQGIIPQVYVIDGNQEAIRRQMIRAGLEVIPESLGRHRVLRIRARPI